MPGLNGKGPEGQGSQTGRGLGKCNPNNQIADTQTAMDDSPRVRGRKRGNGFGFGNVENAGRGRVRGFGRSNW
jgi:hypothetical protein